MASTIRVGVVGVGFGRYVHVPAFRLLPQVEVVAIAASTPARAEAAAQAEGIAKAYGDWRALVADPDVDLVSIATPPILQPQIARAALLQGKALFCEKPLASTPAEAAELMRLAQERGLPAMVDFEFPFLPTWTGAKHLLEQGRLGRLRHVAVQWNLENYANRLLLENWKTRSADGGGALNALGSHCLYYLEWFLGRLVRLSAFLSQAPHDPRSGDTLVQINALTQQGVPVLVTLSTHAYGGNGHRLEFFGDDGTLKLENNTTDYIRGFELLLAERGSEGFRPVLLPQETALSDHADGRVWIVASLLERLLAWMRDGQPRTPTLADGWRVGLLLAAVQEAHQTGSWVAVQKLM